VVAAPPLGRDLLLFDVTTTGLLVAVVAGAAGALLVELVHRLAPLASDDTSDDPAAGGGPGGQADGTVDGVS
jgi:hypothetical protein